MAFHSPIFNDFLFKIQSSGLLGGKNLTAAQTLPLKSYHKTNHSKTFSAIPACYEAVKSALEMVLGQSFETMTPTPIPVKQQPASRNAKHDTHAA